MYDQDPASTPNTKPEKRARRTTQVWKKKGLESERARVNTSVETSLAFYRGLSLEISEKRLKRGYQGLLDPGPKKLEKESK